MKLIVDYSFVCSVKLPLLVFTAYMKVSDVNAGKEEELNTLLFCDITYNFLFPKIFLNPYRSH